MPDTPSAPTAAPRRIFTATLILGVPGAGKTSLFAPFAEYLWETYRKVLLLYSWDGGAIPTPLQKLMKHGLIRFWRARTRSGRGLGVEGAMLATKGYWPARIDRETGETSPGVRLVPPITTRYTITCRKTGEVLAQLPAQHLIAPTYCAPCKTLHAVAELNVVEDVHRTPGFEEIGGVAFDSLTSIGALVMDHLDEARGDGQVGGEKSAFGGAVRSGSLTFGGTSRADYNFAQGRCREAVSNSRSIPYLLEGPVFSALSLEASDEAGLSIVGAKLPGRAATDEASSWFGNVFEMGRTTDDIGREHFTLFLQPFTDSQNRRHLLKTSASPTGLPMMLIDPVDQPWAQANLGLVFRMLDADLRQAMAEEIPGAPGLAGTPTDYGEAFHSTPAPPPTSEHIPQLQPPAQPAPAATAAAVPTQVAVPAAAPVARKRTRVTETPAPAPLPPVAVAAATPATPVAPEPELVGVAAAPAIGPPPPPGMKPPQRLPNGSTNKES